MKKVLFPLLFLVIGITHSYAQDRIDGPSWGPSFRQIEADRYPFPKPWPPETRLIYQPYPGTYWLQGNGLHRGSYGIIFDARTGQFYYPQPRVRIVYQRRCYLVPVYVRSY